jgi:hypothetical protein
MHLWSIQPSGAKFFCLDLVFRDYGGNVAMLIYGNDHQMRYAFYAKNCRKKILEFGQAAVFNSYEIVLPDQYLIKNIGAFIAHRVIEYFKRNVFIFLARIEIGKFLK